MARAIVVLPEQLPKDVVTMNSRRFRGEATGERREVTLVYPAHADIEAGDFDPGSVGSASVGAACRTVE